MISLGTDRLWIEWLLLLSLAFIQLFFVPSLTGGMQSFECLFPYLISRLVIKNYSFGISCALIMALIQETHSNLPAGIYISFYWIYVNCFYLFKENLSWRNYLPWYSSMLMGSLLLFFYESFVKVFCFGWDAVFWDGSYLVCQLLRVISATAVGLMFAKIYIQFQATEERSI